LFDEENHQALYSTDWIVSNLAILLPLNLLSYNLFINPGHPDSGLVFGEALPQRGHEMFEPLLVTLVLLVVAAVVE
jgi:hypothetical protein